jgi:hypothetical protein
LKDRNFKRLHCSKTLYDVVVVVLAGRFPASNCEGVTSVVGATAASSFVTCGSLRLRPKRIADRSAVRVLGG